MNHSSRGAPGAQLLLPLLAAALAMTACPPEKRDYGTSSSSSGMVEVEEGAACLDGADNDDDGAPDCADTGCQDEVACVAPPQLPAGWTGYYRVRTAPYPDAAPAPCPDGSKPATYFVDPAGPAECSSCSCGPIEGGRCGFPQAICFSSFACGNGTPYPLPNGLQEGTCQPAGKVLPLAPQMSCVYVGKAEKLELPSCTPSPVAFGNPVTWGSELHACDVSTTGNGCGPGQICGAVTEDPAEERICIWHADLVSCPPGWGTPIHAYEGGSDTRGCSACECKPETTCIAGSYTFWQDPTCAKNSPFSVIDEPPVCKTFGAPGAISAVESVPSGTCAAQGGAPVGEIVTEGPATFCCTE